MSGRPGGISQEKEADEDVQKVTDQVQVRAGNPLELRSHTHIIVLTLFVQIRASVEEKEGRKYDEFTAVKYCTQVVAGINYFIKVGY